MFVNKKRFLSPLFHIKAAEAPWEVAGVQALRRRVFCQEQAIFDQDDQDEIDAIALPLAAISTVAGFKDQVVGTVRIHQEGEGIWWGSRLAVDHSHRRVGHLGAELIRLAVTTANGIGCTQFFAHVQAQNEKLFTRLHWHRIEDVTIHGQPHVLMQADLDHYPAFDQPFIGWQSMRRGRRL